MKKFIKVFSCLALVSFIATGCAVNRATAMVDPSVNLRALKTLHVVKFYDDQHDVNNLIADKLRILGYTVTTDPEKPAGADAMVTYQDEWARDFTAYMLDLSVVIRDVKTDFPLASGNSYHTSLSRKKPNEMVEEVIDNIFNKGEMK